MEHISRIPPTPRRIPLFLSRLALFFSVSFVLNLIWEHAHSLLYANYRGGEITEFILWRATLGDAIILSLLAAPFLFSLSMRRHLWLLPASAVVVSVAIELYAHATGRWAYNELMPMIPLLNIGLTPTIQLGLLGFIAFKIVSRYH